MSLAVQIASGNPRASETALELQLERMDGVPGNTTFREVFDQATSLLLKRTDRATQIATILGRVADIQTSPDDFVRFGPDVAAETIEEIAEEIRLIDGRNAWVSGSEMYISISNSAALEAVAKLKLAIDKGEDWNTRQNLLKDIIAATSHSSMDRVVVSVGVQEKQTTHSFLSLLASPEPVLVECERRIYREGSGKRRCFLRYRRGSLGSAGTDWHRYLGSQ